MLFFTIRLGLAVLFFGLSGYRPGSSVRFFRLLGLLLVPSRAPLDLSVTVRTVSSAFIVLPVLLATLPAFYLVLSGTFSPLFHELSGFILTRLAAFSVLSVIYYTMHRT